MKPTLLFLIAGVVALLSLAAGAALDGPRSMKLCATQDRATSTACFSFSDYAPPRPPRYFRKATSPKR